MGGSEVLPAEDGKVYYRRRARLLALDDAIRDTHGAFTKH
jgi:hypothetical protein